MNRLQKFFSDDWGIRRDDLEGAVALIMPAIAAGNLAGAAELLGRTKSRAQATGGAPYLAQWYELDDVDIPQDAVAVISLNGMLYNWETQWLMTQIRRAEANPKVCGIVLEIDGPGGMISRVDAAAELIAKCTKPTATVVTGTMASAHFWIGTATDRTFIASPLCEVGSVGVLITHVSFREFFKQNGIDYRVIYPDTADLKNKEVRALEDNGDEQPFKDHAEKIHRLFAETVARNLGISYDPELPLFRGEMFDAAEAVASGYIDEHGGLEDAVRWVLAQSVISKIDEKV